MEKINVITMCSGYDSQCLALERLKSHYPQFDYELVAWAEFDPMSKQPVEKQPAVIAHNALFPQYADRNMGDITKCDWSKIKEHIDLLFYSTPCQSISSAGLQHGLKEGSGTRSSIIWNVLDAIDTLKPKYLVLENVKALVSEKFMKDFKDWCNQLEIRGYANFWQILNSKNYGVPQNRERVFLVSVKGYDEMYYFPEPFKLTTRLKDVLEQNVDEKYYLSKKMLEYFEGIDKISECTDKLPKAIGYSRDAKGNVVNRFLKNITNTIKSTGKGGNQDVYIAEPQIIQIGNFMPDRKYNNCQRGRLYSTNGISPCLASACGEGGNITPKIIQVGNIDKRKDGFSNPQRGRVYSDEGISPTIDTMERGNAEPKIVDTYRIRKLTPRECFRLMGVSDTDIDKIQAAGISNSQQYKMAGNSIVVDCLFHIFRKMFVDKGNESQQLTLFDF